MNLGGVVVTKISDIIFDVDLIIEDDGKYYTTKAMPVVDAWDNPVKMVLSKDKRITKKELLE